MLRVDRELFYRVGRCPEIVVAAPHHGIVEGSDCYTKEVAEMLAKRLGAALVVAENLRPLVDLNKQPELAASPALQYLCRIYQEYALASEVGLFLEIHSHINGYYDLELSCGFPFDRSSPFDGEFEQKLASLRRQLRREILQNWSGDLPLPAPTLGVYPFDRDVYMKATKTYLFQRIRELQRRGRRIFGLHIEIFRDYKIDDPSSPIYACQETLVTALEMSIKAAFTG